MIARIFILAAVSAGPAAGAAMTFTSPGYDAGGATTALTGSLGAGSLTWTRPTALGQFRTPTSAFSSGRQFEAKTFTPAVTAAYEVSQTGVLAAGRNTFVYAGSFNPNTPLQNLLIGWSGTGNFGTPVLTAGQPYTFVTSNTNAGTFGAYALNLKQGATGSGIAQIPDGSPTGATFTITVSDPGQITAFSSVQLLGVRGAAAGDFLVTLTHVETGKTVDLMDRLTGDTGGFGTDISIGNMLGNFGSADYTFVDSGGTAWPASTSSNVTPGTYNLFSGTAGFESSAANGALSLFAGDSVAGTWRLTVSDLDSFPGSAFSSIAGFRFTADISPVPEPAAGSALLLPAAAALMRRRRR